MQVYFRGLVSTRSGYGEALGGAVSGKALGGAVSEKALGGALYSEA